MQCCKSEGKKQTFWTIQWIKLSFLLCWLVNILFVLIKDKFHLISWRHLIHTILPSTILFVNTLVQFSAYYLFYLRNYKHRKFHCSWILPRYRAELDSRSKYCFLFSNRLKQQNNYHVRSRFRIYFLDLVPNALLECYFSPT